VLLVAMLLPSAATWMYFVVLSGHPAMKWAYSACKVVQFALPIAWLVWAERSRLQLTRPQGRHVGVGLLLGLAMVAAGLAAYYGYFRGSSHLAAAPELVRAKLDDMGLTIPAAYLAFAAFLSIPHSLLEEYYWRWFVFGRLRSVVPAGWAVLLSAAAFAAHHVIVLERFLHGAWEATALFSACVALGGALWAWLYHRTGSLYAPWASHILVDCGIFFIGYDLVWGR
jgi:membrane protease YdiL (CAAX protease family)